MKKRKLRWQMAVPLTVAFALLWLGTMALLTVSAYQEMRSFFLLQVEYAYQALNEQMNLYRGGLASGLGTKAQSILRTNLSAASTGLSEVDGGTAFYVQDEEGNIICSQLAWGTGRDEDAETYSRRDWYLEFDAGLDDEGQLELARWLMEHGGFAGFILASPEQVHIAASVKDGTYARVTGLERPGNTILVQELELIHPDGTAETILETGAEGEDPITVELNYLELNSALAAGGAQMLDLEHRLANFREAQESTRTGLRDGSRSFSRSTVSSNLEGGYNWRMEVVGYYDRYFGPLRQQAPLYVSTFLLTAAVVLLLAWYLSGKVTRPVEYLSRAAKGGYCVENGPIRELNALAGAINEARRNLADQLDRERNFTRAAAHELKTPLAVLRPHAEALKEETDPARREQYLDIILDESDRMAALVGSLLEVSRLESGAPLQREPVELSALVGEVWERRKFQAEQKDLRLTLELEEIPFVGDRARLEEAADNLASNALRHCPEGRAIRVTLSRTEERACLEVYNEGEAIPDRDLPRLWDPFYRGDASRSRESGGTGLGLAITRAAVLAHRGSCEVENQPGGVCFRLWLPL